MEEVLRAEGTEGCHVVVGYLEALYWVSELLQWVQKRNISVQAITRIMNVRGEPPLGMDVINGHGSSLPRIPMDKKLFAFSFSVHKAPCCFDKGGETDVLQSDCMIIYISGEIPQDTPPKGTTVSASATRPSPTSTSNNSRLHASLGVYTDFKLLALSGLGAETLPITQCPPQYPPPRERQPGGESPQASVSISPSHPQAHKAMAITQSGRR